MLDYHVNVRFKDGITIAFDYHQVVIANPNDVPLRPRHFKEIAELSSMVKEYYREHHERFMDEKEEENESQ